MVVTIAAAMASWSYQDFHYALGLFAEGFVALARCHSTSASQRLGLEPVAARDVHPPAHARFAAATEGGVAKASGKRFARKLKLA